MVQVHTCSTELHQWKNENGISADVYHLIDPKSKEQFPLSLSMTDSQPLFASHHTLILHRHQKRLLSQLRSHPTKKIFWCKVRCWKHQIRKHSLVVKYLKLMGWTSLMSWIYTQLHIFPHVPACLASYGVISKSGFLMVHCWNTNPVYVWMAKNSHLGVINGRHMLPWHRGLPSEFF